jgi:uncharacterized protein
MTTQMQTAVGRFVWHDLNTTDVEAATRFYTELLGWDVEVWKPGEMDYPMINAKGSQHGGFGPAQGGAPSHWVGHVVVDNADAAGKRAQGAGGSVIVDPMDIPEVGRFTIVRDPQGSVISAFQPASGSDATVPEGVFAWDELYTNDVDAAKRFYREVFGWTTEDMDMGEFTYTLFKSGDAQVAGGMTIPEGEETPPHWYPYLATDDVDATTEKAKELGAKVYHGPADIPGDMGRISVLGDPTGATFGLHHYKGSS